MKLNNIVLCLILGYFNTSCLDNFLNKEPLSELTPESFLMEESQLASYAINLYSMFPTHENHSYGTFEIDKNTDNQAASIADEKYSPGQWRVPENGGEWNFENIYKCNYFLNIVQSRVDNGEIRGDINRIKHYLGEVYMLRAYDYFQRVMKLGDFPIITQTMTEDNKALLIESSKRRPHSEVIRFIIEDLDKAIELMLEESPDGANNRLSKKCALLFKSRVALYEATWLKYFKGTAFVPNGNGWPGGQKDYNKGYQYRAGNIDKEIEWLLEQAMESSEIIAENVKLVENTGVLPQTLEEYNEVNPYLMMFGSVDMSIYPEVLLWRKYDQGLGITHAIEVHASGANGAVGATRGLIEGFLMKNGLPIYAKDSNWAGDDDLENVIKDRDNRLELFLRIPGQKNILINEKNVTHVKLVEVYPQILLTETAITGYLLRKGASFDGFQASGNGISTVGSIVFRAVEAYLNYIESCYERYGYLNDKAKKYWSEIRKRAKVDVDFEKTINSTEIEKEAKLDWGAYSAGNLVDETLYNIRRERRCELMAEGLRDMDLCRWRSKDQMIYEPYHIEGFKLFNSTISTWYQDEDGNWDPNLTWGNSKATVSDPSESDYLRPYRITGKELVYDGYRWVMAHYWSPIAIKHFLLTSDNEDYSDSPIYQNPGWPLIAGQGAK